MGKYCILVTGGAGYIGSHTVKELLKQGYELVVVDSLENGFENAVVGGKLVKCDLRDKEQLNQIFAENKIDGVVHFAAYASVPDSVENPAKYFDNNITGGMNLLEAMRGNGVRRIVFSSSASVYGEPQSEVTNEDHPKSPTNPYGLTKWQFEQILGAYDRAYGIKSVSLRYFCASGADPDGKIGENHDPETHVIPLAILTALGKREAFKIFGDDYPTPDGTGIRDFIHVSDLAGIHVAALKYLDNGCGTDYFNCGNKKGYSVKEIIEWVKKISGKEFKVIVEGRRPGDPARLIADSSKMSDVLGYKNQYSDLKTIIETAWEWYKKHPNGYKEK
ncbi:MAG: UDP-glucose 4-epimerase GalE [bacterium]|nr:UDP-glucose 4-epimerase GalE [bacterium]